MGRSATTPAPDLASLAALLAVPSTMQEILAELRAIRLRLDQAEKQPTHLPVPEAAKQLGVSEASVWRAIRSGKLQTVLVSARCRRVVMPKPTDTSTIAAMARKARQG